MQFIVEMTVLCARIGGCAFIEHPAFPVCALPHRPSSTWSSKEMRWLKRLHCSSVVTFDQCLFGCEGRKPTTLLLVRLRGLRDRILQMGRGGRCCHPVGSHEGLQGRRADGSFRTAVAKIYPPALNAALADAVFEFVGATFPLGHSTVPLPDDLCAMLRWDFVSSDGKAQGKGKDNDSADFGPPVLPMGVSDTPWMNQASSNVLPPLPPPALSEAEEKLRAYDQPFKKHKDALTPEFQTDLQQITKEDKIKETEVTTNVLHKQVKALGYARKELAAANSARMNLHVSWRAFLTDQVQKWKTYSSNFQSQEAAMSQRVTDAIAAVEAAKTDFVNSKKSLGDMSITEEVQTISDDDMDPKQSSASGAQISDSLAHLTSSLQQLQENADQAITAEQQAAKRPRLEELPVPTPSALPPEGAPPFR
eukprot:s84_g26.t1